jgi:hypothetical protein
MFYRLDWLPLLRIQRAAVFFISVSLVAACVEERQMRAGEPLCVDEACSPASNDAVAISPFDMRQPDGQSDALADAQFDRGVTDLPPDLPPDANLPGEAILAVDMNIDTSYDLPLDMNFDALPPVDFTVDTLPPIDLTVDTVPPDMPPLDATPYVYQFAKTSSWLPQVITPGSDVVDTLVSGEFLYILENTNTIPPVSTLHRYDLVTHQSGVDWPKVIPTGTIGNIHAIVRDPVTDEFFIGASLGTGEGRLYRSGGALQTFIHRLTYGYPPSPSDRHVSLENDGNHIYVANAHTSIVHQFVKTTLGQNSWQIPQVLPNTKDIYTTIANGRLYMYLEEAAGIVSTDLAGGAPSTKVIPVVAQETHQLVVKGDYAWITSFENIITIDLVAGQMLSGKPYTVPYLSHHVLSPHGLHWVNDTLVVVDRCGRAHGFEDCAAVPACKPLDGGLGGVDCDGAI